MTADAYQVPLMRMQSWKNEYCQRIRAILLKRVRFSQASAPDPAAAASEKNGELVFRVILFRGRERGKEIVSRQFNVGIKLRLRK